MKKRMLFICCCCFPLYFEKSSEASLLLLVFRCHLPWFYFSFYWEFMDKNDINKRTRDTACSKIAKQDQVSMHMLSLRLLDTFILSTKLMQLLIRKQEEKDALRTQKFPINWHFSYFWNWKSHFYPVHHTKHWLWLQKAFEGLQLDKYSCLTEVISKVLHDTTSWIKLLPQYNSEREVKALATELKQ